MARRGFMGTAVMSLAGASVASGGRRRSAEYIKQKLALRALKLKRYQLLVRRKLSGRKRIAMVVREYRRGIFDPTPNQDEEEIPGNIANYTKALPHDDSGKVDPSAYETLKAALDSGVASDFERIPLDPTSVRKLANPQAALAYDVSGGDSHCFAMPAAPAFSSAQEASEMGEVYLHALLRDIPFDEYTTSSEVSRAVSQMNSFSDFRGPKAGGQVTAGTLFRGETAGDLVGNYLSQFLLLPIPESGSTRDQLYRVPIQNFDHMVSRADWLNVLRGGAPTTSTTFDPDNRYLSTGRDLAEYVHSDFSYQAYLNAALILLGSGSPTQTTNLYSSSSNQGAFITFGGAEILSSVATVALQGLKAAWYQKWKVHRRLRPEVFGGWVDDVKEDRESYPVHAEMLDSEILDDVFAKTGNYLLPMAYPEGSPTHPAYPAGHAVIAGACCTVLKAFFDGNALISNPVQVDPTSEATELQPYGGALKVGDEINKLANNIALGRDIAGVHWRTDGTEGLLLGEQVAIRYLEDQKDTYSEVGSSVSFVGFGGNNITV